MKLSAGLRQSLVTVIANIISFNVGIAIGWTSPNNPKLQDRLMKDTPLDRIPSNEEMSWIGPLVPLGAILSPFLAGPLTNRFGPKRVLLGTALFYIASYIILGLGKSLSLIYVARLLQGFGMGINMAIVPIYIGEISQDLYRGALGTILVLFFVTGILIVFVIGPFVSYVALQYICLVFPVSFFVLFVFMPESPFFTLMIGDTEQTKKSLRFLRGTSNGDIEAEMQDIKKLIENSGQPSWSNLFTNRGNLKALLICSGLMWIQQFSGINAVIMYAQPIFEKAGGSIKPEISSIIVAANQVLANIITTAVIDRFGRKLILMISNVGMTISMAVLGIYFFLDHEKLSLAESVTFLPITSMIVFIFVFSFGFGPIPWALIGEMFPSDVKSSASTIVSAACWTFAFLVTKFYAPLEEAIGAHWTFWIFTICLSIGIVFTYLYVIETKGLTLQQIQDKLHGVEN